MQAAELTREIQDTDKSRLLSMEDCIDAAGQLLRSTAPMFYEGLDHTSIAPTPKDLGW